MLEIIIDPTIQQGWIYWGGGGGGAWPEGVQGGGAIFHDKAKNY